MAWSSLSSNQAVSYIDAQTSGATLKAGQTNPGTNQCMTRLDVVTKYNVNVNILLCADNQLAVKGLWEIISGFSTALIVGNASNQFGYREGSYGDILSNDISTPAGANAVLRDLYFQASTLAFTITNGSTTVQPSGWTTLTVGSFSYNRTSFSVSYNLPTNRWIYTLSTATNPFGTTVGAPRTITLI